MEKDVFYFYLALIIFSVVIIVLLVKASKTRQRNRKSKGQGHTAEEENLVYDMPSISNIYDGILAEAAELADKEKAAAASVTIPSKFEPKVKFKLNETGKNILQYALGDAFFSGGDCGSRFIVNHLHDSGQDADDYYDRAYKATARRQEIESLIEKYSTTAVTSADSVEAENKLRLNQEAKESFAEAIYAVFYLGFRKQVIETTYDMSIMVP
jgi:hypothetical protein